MQYKEYKGGETMEDCLFCSIIQGKIPCQKVYEDEYVLSFKDISPEAPVHVLIIPKKHISSINALESKDMELISHVYSAAQKIVKIFKIDESGYRIVTNCGENGGQTVPHIHFHLLGGRSLNWPPG